MTARLVDSDVLIDVLRGIAPATAWLGALPEAPVVPGFVAMELVQGCERADDLRRVQALLGPLVVVWPSPNACDQMLAHSPRFHLRHGLGMIDALVAACAVERSATLCTFNLKHYRAVPGLLLEAPYERPPRSGRQS